MGQRLQKYARKIRVSKGSFSLAPINMRLKFDPSQPSVPDSSENLKALIEACRELGFELGEA
jgi:hypothetical protein